MFLTLLSDIVRKGFLPMEILMPMKMVLHQKGERRTISNVFCPKKPAQRVVDEVDLYLQEDPLQSVIEIEKDSLLRKGYVRYNTPLPSSASLERLLSRAHFSLTDFKICRAHRFSKFYTPHRQQL